MKKQEDDNNLIKIRLQSIFENMQDAFFKAYATALNGKVEIQT